MPHTAASILEAAARHTSGPWAVTGQSQGGRYITVQAATGRTVARVPFNSKTDVEAGAITDAADAALIAAAPHMLVALRQAAVALAAIRGEQFRAPQMSALDAVREAIAEAEPR